MSGPCGAGKTTLAKILSEERGLRYLGIEDFYAAFFGSELIHEHEDEVWEAFAIAIRSAMFDDVDVIIDTNAPTRADREWFFERFPDFEFNLICVSASRDICILNNSKRERTIPEKELITMYDAVELPSDAEISKYASVAYYENLDNTGLKFIKSITNRL